MCYSQIAGNTGRKSDAKIAICATLSGCIFATKACIDNRKNLLNSNISCTCPHNMANFGPLTAKTVSLVWGTLANFNGFRVLPSLLQRRRSLTGGQPAGVSQTLRRGTRNGITELSQTAPPIFGRAAIKLGIGPHYSSFFFPRILSGRRLDVYHTSTHDVALVQI